MAILTNAECLSLSRQNSGFDSTKMEPYRLEALNIDIKPAIKDNLFIDLVTYTESDDPEENLLFDTLLNGGEYTYSNVKYYFAGLKKTAAYFAYARMIKGADIQPTLFGIRVKDVDQSDQPDYKQKIQFANDTISVGNQYLYDCVSYIKRMLPTYYGSVCYNKKRSKFKIIGD